MQQSATEVKKTNNWDIGNCTVPLEELSKCKPTPRTG